jgi:predicted aspartyl protease
MKMRFAALPLALVLLLPSLAAADGGNMPDEDAIQKQIEGAAGKRPDNERVTVTSVRSGETTTQRSWRIGEDERTQYVDEPFETQDGTYKGQDWGQDENGITILQPEEPGNERKVQYQTSIRRITTPVSGYLIARLDPQGYGTRRYVDGTTWRVVRREYVSRTATTTVLYDDFRTVGGYTRPYHWTLNDGHPENATDERVTEATIGAVTADDVKIPARRRDLLTFPPGTTSVVLPAHVDGPRIIVRANVGKRGLDFEMDTGASSITLDAGVAQQLGLKVYSRYSAVTAQRYQTGRAVIPVLTIGAFELHDVAVDVIPTLQGQGGDTKVVGLLGFDFLAQAAYKIDYERARVTAYPSAGLTTPSAKDTIALDVRLGTGQPLITAAINGYSADRFVLDTGGEGSFVLFDYFARRYPDALKKGAYSDGASMLGVGGAFSTRGYRAASLTVGRLMFTNVDGYLVTTGGAFEGEEDGLIGSSFLRLFDVWLDYTTSHVYLVPNTKGQNAGL